MGREQARSQSEQDSPALPHQVVITRVRATSGGCHQEETRTTTVQIRTGRGCHAGDALEPCLSRPAAT